MPALRTIPVYQVDAFTDAPFRGNPAAVCLMDPPLDNDAMQEIAAEMNLSETAFVTALGGVPFHMASRFLLQWFTPKVEVPLCGHATLATSAVLFFEMENSQEALQFHTKSGVLQARCEDDTIILNFPAEQTEKIDPPEEILAALGIEASVEVRYGKKIGILMVVLEQEEDVRELAPDFKKLRLAPVDFHVEGVIVTAPGSDPFHFISRYFGPWVGIDEDPVTGSAHTLLGPYWSDRFDEEHLLAQQVSAREGEIEVIVKKGGRVELRGEAVVVMKGMLYV